MLGCCFGATAGLVKHQSNCIPSGKLDSFSVKGDKIASVFSDGVMIIVFVGGGSTDSEVFLF